MASLATIEDVEALLGSTITDGVERAEALLAQVSARFRREARQEFTPGESTVRLKTVGGVVFLREQPATEVVSVVGPDGQPVGFEHHGQEVAISSGSMVLVLDSEGSPMSPLRMDERSGPQLDFVTVTYRHGGAVPAAVVGAVADAVRRIIGVDPDASAGVTQQTDSAGIYSRTRQYATWAVGGQALLSPDEITLARSFRPVIPKSWVLRP